MMLAQREHLNVLDCDHLVGVLVEDALLHRVGDGVLVAFSEERQGLPAETILPLYCN